MTKIDLRKDLKHLYQAPAKAPALVEVPAMSFLMIEGRGDPNLAPEFPKGIEALYNLAYTLKFMIKKEEGLDYAVMYLEGLWYVEDMTKFSPDRKDLWQWTLMIMQPEFVTPELVQRARDAVQKKKNFPELSQIRFEGYDEGPAAQIMHIGPYSDEWPGIARLHDFIAGQGYALRGKHHEIYLNDPRRTAPEKLKTIIRQPVARI